MSFQIDLAWGGYPFQEGMPHCNDRQRLRIISDNREPSDVYMQKHQHRDEWEYNNNSSHSENCKRNISKDDDGSDLRVYLQDKLKDRKVEKAIKDLRRLESISRPKNVLESEENSHFISPSRRYHESKTQDLELSQVDSHGRSNKFLTEYESYYPEKPNLIPKRKRIKSVPPENNMRGHKMSEAIELVEAQNCKPKLKEKRDQKHSYREEIARKEKELKLHESKRQLKHPYKDIKDRDIGSDAHLESSAYKIPIHVDDPNMRMVTKTGRMYPSLKDMKFEESNKVHVSSKVKRPLLTEKEVKLAEKILVIEKEKEGIKKKYEKISQKVEKWKRKFVKEQAHSKNLTTRIKELEAENSELQIEANLQTAWRNIVKKNKKSKIKSKKKVTRCEKIDSFSENLSGYSTASPQKTVKTPIKSTNEQEYSSCLISEVAPLHSSTPASHVRNLATDNISISDLNEEKYKGTEVISVSKEEILPDKEITISNEDKTNDFMRIIETEMQAAETLWEFEITRGTPTENNKILGTDNFQAADLNESCIDSVIEIPIKENSLHSNKNKLSDSIMKVNAKKVPKTNEFMKLSAMKLKDPIIQAIIR